MVAEPSGLNARPIKPDSGFTDRTVAARRIQYLDALTKAVTVFIGILSQWPEALMTAPWKSIVYHLIAIDDLKHKLSLGGLLLYLDDFPTTVQVPQNELCRLELTDDFCEQNMVHLLHEYTGHSTAITKDWPLFREIKTVRLGPESHRSKDLTSPPPGHRFSARLTGIRLGRIHREREPTEPSPVACAARVSC